MNLSKTTLEKLGIILIALVCVLFGSINNMDLGISTLFYNADTLIGRFFENHALLVVFLPVIYAGLSLWKTTKNQLYFLIALAVSFYAGYGNLKTYTTSILQIIFGLVLGAVFFLALFLFVSSKKTILSQNQIILYKKIIVTFLTIVIVVHTIKIFDGRIRFRDFTDRLNYSEYTNWFEFKFLGKGNSFPSGHASTFYVLIPILTMFQLEKTKFRFVAYGLVFLMAFYRIRIGAHFLTDTMIAIVIAVSIDLLITKFGGRYLESKTTSI